ncbi:MAG: glutamate 5-kinase [Hyphomicrobiales bacterium]|nr:glutamate 5-kinase [Hyphomicrobiales bacterium]MCP5374476.1 glutamate 5-kinase [Hyphomicrobiales bacterium]
MNPHRSGTDLAAGRRIVVKIGSALLVDQERGTVHRRWLEGLAEDLAGLYAQGKEVVIVSSGAIAVGRRYLRFADGVLRLEEKQAAAATGMVHLAHAYQEVLARHDMTVAQVLLTIEDTENRRRYINARNTLDTLLRLGAVPLINENDTVATEEIRVGDNDRLGARVAAMISADTLVLLSDIDGLYTADPHSHADARLIPQVDAITAEVEAMAGATNTAVGTGGMVTKLAAAKIAMGAGCRMVITDGRPERPLGRLLEGANATWFLPSATPRTARKGWIAGSLKPMGAITLDAGAVAALERGKSLLPAGVTAVSGRFERGDAVLVLGPDGRELGRGLSAYSSADAKRIMGHKTSEIERTLGYRGRDEMIHRDDLVVN